jgi:hypothetical protein
LLHLVGHAQQTEIEKEQRKKKKQNEKQEKEKKEKEKEEEEEKTKEKKKKTKKKKKAGRKQGQYTRSQKGGASLPGPPKITARPDNGHALSHLR